MSTILKMQFTTVTYRKDHRVENSGTQNSEMNRLVKIMSSETYSGWRTKGLKLAYTYFSP